MRYATQHAHYLTVSESRRWAMDHPVGNPHHDFKTKEMPVVAVAMIAYGAAGMAGIVTMNVVAAGLMMAGGALSLAGSITGNKTLSMIGSVVGLAAGAVGLFESMGTAAASGMEVAGSVAEPVVATAEGGLEISAAAEAAGQSGGVAGMESANAISATADGGLTIGLDGGASVGDVAGSMAQNMDAAPVDAAMVGSGDATSLTELNQLQGTGGYSDGGMQTIEGPTISGGPEATAAKPFQDTSGYGPSTTGYQPPGNPELIADTGRTVNIDGTTSGMDGFKDTSGYGPSTDLTKNAPKGLIAQAKDAISGVSKDTLGFAKDAFGVVRDINKESNGKLMDMGGNVAKSYGEKDLMKAQEELARAQASGVQANVDLAKARVEEVNYSLELQRKKYANANSRATSAAAQAGAVNANANIYSQPAQQAQGGLIFSGAK